jgi:hypothetical protein
MRKRKYLVGALLSVIGALIISGTASAAVVSQTYTVTGSPPKQNKKVFGPLKTFTNVVDTTYSGGFTPNATQTVLTFSRDFKFTPGNTPQCPLSSVNNQKQSTAQANCSSSIIGTGSAIINGGQLNASVTAFNGQPSGGSPTIYLHTAVKTPSGTEVLDPTLTGVLNTHTNTLTVSIPPTGTSITHFDTTITKRKTGKKSFYVMARCKKKKWTSSETTTFSDGTTKTASFTQKCKQKK